VALALAVEYDGAPNGRVRDVPDARTIRYYTTLGLIDRPADMRGRTALYGRRHLLQLVAIKRLQGRGLSLAEIQAQLVGQSNASLARWARLPEEAETPATMAPTPRSGSFWTAAPAEVAPEAAAVREAAPLPLQGLALGEDVVLLLTPARLVEEEDLEAIRVAAAPLLKLLAKRRLLRPRNERGTS
jgi:DNA-binding transcriptional MerR regulator